MRVYENAYVCVCARECLYITNEIKTEMADFEIIFFHSQIDMPLIKKMLKLLAKMQEEN